MWYIGFQGETNGDVQNLYAYHDDGTPHQDPKVLPEGGPNPVLSELRGFALRDDRLYVLDAKRDDSQVLVYTGTGGGYEFTTCLASPRTVNSILHPYDLTFDDAGNCYVSSQDTNVVTGLDPAGHALDVAPYLEQTWPPPARFLDGTRVASSVGDLPGVPLPAPPDVAPPLGLTVKRTDGKVTKSVRGVCVVGDALYVADEPAGAVKVYDLSTGELSWQIAGDNLSAPVQLLFDPTGTVLYIGSSRNASVVYYGFTDDPPAGGSVTASTFIDGLVPHVSGMAIDPNGYFYAALRKKKQILRFDADGTNPVTFIADLPDEPEFIEYVPTSG